MRIRERIFDLLMAVVVGGTLVIIVNDMRGCTTDVANTAIDAILENRK